MKLSMPEKGDSDAETLEFEDAAPAAPSGAGSIASTIGARNLLIIIITMPFVFLVVVMTIIAIFGNPNKDEVAADDGATPGAVRSTPVATLEEPALQGRRVSVPINASAGDLAASIALPKGGEAGAIALDGDRLALRVDSAEGGVIVIYDLAENRVVQTVPLIEAAGSAMSLGELTVSEKDDLAEDAYANDGAPEAPSLSAGRGE